LYILFLVVLIHIVFFFIISTTSPATTVTAVAAATTTTATSPTTSATTATTTYIPFANVVAIAIMIITIIKDFIDQTLRMLHLQGLKLFHNLVAIYTLVDQLQDELSFLNLNCAGMKHLYSSLLLA